jgi:hypothetical protein
MDERYQKGKIYRIVCNVTGDVYIGSTIQTLGMRLACHKIDARRGNVGSSQIIKRGDFKIELIENYQANSREELLWRERHFIDNTDCINKLLPIATKEERRLMHLKCATERYHTNKEEITKYKKEPIKCECGRVVRRGDVPKHLRTKIHLELISQQTTNEATTQDKETVPV